MADEPENLILHLLRDMRERMATKDDIADLRSEIADVRSEVHSLRADVASDLMMIEKRMGDQEKRLSDQIVGLRRAVVEYHSSAVGHGVLISEIDERLRVVERKLNIETH